MKKFALLVLIGLVLSGCGSPPDNERSSNQKPDENQGAEEQPSTKQVAALTVATGTARTYSEQTMRFPGSDGASVTETEGVIDFDNGLQHATMTSSGTGPVGSAIADQVGDMELIGKGLVIYMKSAFFQDLIPGAKEWLKMDLQAIGELQGMDLGSLTQLNGNDPSASLDYLRGVEDVEIVGEEEVRGVPTTHWEGVATWDSMRRELGKDAAATIDNLQSMLDIEEFGIEAWIDDENLLRRARFTYGDLPIPELDGEWILLIEFYDFGVDVDVSLPPEEETTDLFDLMQGALEQRSP